MSRSIPLFKAAACAFAVAVAVTSPASAAQTQNVIEKDYTRAQSDEWATYLLVTCTNGRPSEVRIQYALDSFAAQAHAMFGVPQTSQGPNGRFKYFLHRDGNFSFLNQENLDALMHGRLPALRGKKLSLQDAREFAKEICTPAIS